jgi:hypothetical protein
MCQPGRCPGGHHPLADSCLSGCFSKPLYVVVALGKAAGKERWVPRERVNCATPCVLIRLLAPWKAADVVIHHDRIAVFPEGKQLLAARALRRVRLSH